MCTEHCHINQDTCVVEDLFAIAIHIDRTKGKLGVYQLAVLQELLQAAYEFLEEVVLS
jgi:hypothetical protein